MMFKLPPLPYKKSDLSPFLSEEQISFHYEGHHRAYIDNLNKELQNNPQLKAKSLEEIILTSSGKTFDNAAQIWNHTFYWSSLSPEHMTGIASSELNAAILRDYENLDTLKLKFIQTGMNIFGSGWLWLCTDNTGNLFIVPTANAEVPFKNSDKIPLLNADIWEHAYYLDYKNVRLQYLENLWKHINWKFASENYANRKVKNLTPQLLDNNVMTSLRSLFFITY